MKNTNKLKSVKCYLNHSFNYVRQISFIFFLLLSFQAYAQQEIKTVSYGIQAGVNTGILDNVRGPSISIHYAYRTENILQIESMVFFDKSTGTSFLSGDSQKNYSFGLVGGLRINIFPKYNWNPSFLILPGFIYGFEKSSRYGRNSAGSVTLCLAFSNTFYKKHMISIGLNPGQYNGIIYLKYGFWF